MKKVIVDLLLTITLLVGKIDESLKEDNMECSLKTEQKPSVI
jgi:hypothetical protein